MLFKTDHWVLYNGEFLPAGTHQIDDKDVEAMRPYGEIVEEPEAPAKSVSKSKSKSKKVAEDDILS